MATVIINHQVKEYNTWKAGFDGDAQAQQGMGAKLLAVGHKAGDPSNVWIVFDVADVNAIAGALGNPEFQKRLEGFGVMSTDVTVLQ